MESLISVDQLINEIKQVDYFSSKDEKPLSSIVYKCHLYSIIDRLPKIERTSIPVQSKWIQKLTALGKEFSTCNHCQTSFKIKVRKSYELMDFSSMNFCPNCGSKMKDT